MAYILFQDQGSIHVPCIDRQILIHCTIRKVQFCFFRTFWKTHSNAFKSWNIQSYLMCRCIMFWVIEKWITKKKKTHRNGFLKILNKKARRFRYSFISFTRHFKLNRFFERIIPVTVEVFFSKNDGDYINSSSYFLQTVCIYQYLHEWKFPKENISGTMMELLINSQVKLDLNPRPAPILLALK